MWSIIDWTRCPTETDILYTPLQLYEDEDICMSTISLLVMTLIAFGVLAVAYMSLVTAIKILYIPLVYLVIMWFVTKKAAKSRANRIVVLVIKNAVQGL